MSTFALSPDPSGTTVSRRAWWALVVLLAGMFMALLDTSIVNVALQTIRTSLNANEATLSWVISGYALAFGLLLIPAGRFGDRFGHKWIFIVGVSVFVLSSVWCGLAQSSTELVVARVVQGVGGGIYVPAVASLIQLMFPGRIRGRAFGVMGAVIGISTALGPLVGGLLIQAFGEAEGWRSIFFVNAPIGILTVIAAIALVPGGAEGKRLSTDAVGLLLAIAALVALLVPLIEGEDLGWPLWTWLSLAGGVVLLIGFAFWERHVAKTTTEPLVPPHLFSHPQFTGGVLLAFVYFAAFTSIFFTISLLWQAGLGHTALESGLVSLPFSIGNIVGATASDRVARRLGRNVLSLGTGLVAIGLISLWLLLWLSPTQDLTNWGLLPELFVAGVGSGLFVAPNARFIVATVDNSEAGAANGVIQTVQRVGSAIGIAIIGSVLFAQIPSSFAPSKAKAAQIAQQHAAGGPDAIKHAIAQYIDHGLAVAFGNGAALAMLTSAIFAVCAFLLVFALPKKVGLE
ncbi:MFS transporter [Humibacter albus]|uniref:MFS transporter n=1 Tax=Humibacter albus TaxID=427754 RepID=UPI0003B68389|nr:MFS transporter [Humibacter albus]